MWPFPQELFNQRECFILKLVYSFLLFLSFLSSLLVLDYFMSMFCLHVCLYITCVPDAWGGQNRVSNPLKLKLQMVVSHQAGGNKNALNCRAAAPAHHFLIDFFIVYAGMDGSEGVCKVDSLLPCEYWGLNIGCQTWWRISLPSEPPWQPTNFYIQSSF